MSFPPATLSIPPGPMEKTVSRRAVAVPPSPSGRTRSPAYDARTDARLEEGGRQRLAGFLEDLGHVLRLDGDGGRVAVEVGVGRPEQEQPVPRDGERDADVVLRDGQRRAPVASARDEHVHALAEPHRRAGARILESADASTHGPAAFTVTRALHVDDVAVDLDLRAAATFPSTSRSATTSARLTTVAPACRRGEDVLEAESRVVRPGVGVQRARAQPVETELRHRARAARSGRTSQFRRDRARVE